MNTGLCLLLDRNAAHSEIPLPGQHKLQLAEALCPEKIPVSVL